MAHLVETNPEVQAWITENSAKIGDFCRSMKERGIDPKKYACAVTVADDGAADAFAFKLRNAPLVSRNAAAFVDAHKRELCEHTWILLLEWHGSQGRLGELYFSLVRLLPGVVAS